MPIGSITSGVASKVATFGRSRFVASVRCSGRMPNSTSLPAYPA